jgi:threonine aldolase
MREAMASAAVGDDVFDEDPTIHALETEVARITGKEAALFVTSGTMSNQLAIALHTQPGDEVIVGEGAHVVFYESGAGAALSGVQFAIAGAGGFFTPSELDARVHAPAYWSPRSRLVCLENTHNRAGGRIFPHAMVLDVTARARDLGLGTHLDGARLWNTCVATGLSIETLAAPFDTVSVCFSKGLGAPVGSALCGPREWLLRARTLRKRWGGGMRQSGILAAGALYALRHHRDRLAVDHEHARRLASGLATNGEGLVAVGPVETNIVNIDLVGGWSAAKVADRARALGLALNPSGPTRLRAVTHLDVSESEIERAVPLLLEAIRLERGAA